MTASTARHLVGATRTPELPEVLAPMPLFAGGVLSSSSMSPFGLDLGADACAKIARCKLSEGLIFVRLDDALSKELLFGSSGSLTSAESITTASRASAIATLQKYGYDTLIFSPGATVNLDQYTAKVAGIPEEAEFFSCCHGAMAMRDTIGPSGRSRLRGSSELLSAGREAGASVAAAAAAVAKKEVGEGGSSREHLQRHASAPKGRLRRWGTSRSSPATTGLRLTRSEAKSLGIDMKDSLLSFLVSGGCE